MGEIKKGKQPLRHKYVFNERGEVVNAADLTKETKAAHKYYIRGLDADGNQANEEVMTVLPEINQNHFRRYTTKSKKSINRVSINQREFSESIIHKLAKQLFSTGKIDKIYLPEDMLQLDRSRISGSKDSITSISSCELEKKLVTTSGRHIVVDIYCLLANGKHLIVEIAATHKCTEDKISKLRELNIDTVEIDISDMILDKPLKDGVEEELLRRIGKGGEYTRWLYNTQKNRLEQFFNKLVLFKLEKTKFKHKRDGDWYIWAGVRKEDIHNCRNISLLGESGEANKRDMLTQVDCKGCSRMLYEDWDGQTGVMACNQSEMTNTELLRYIASMSGAIIK